MFAIYTLKETATASSASICPERGGILISFVSHGKELLYLDEDTFGDPSKNVRGGNPILFPICGQLPNSTYTWNDKVYHMKNHGVARIFPWKVEAFQGEASADGSGAYLTISLESSAETLASFPFAFRLVFTYRLEGGKLTIQQSIRHLDATAGAAVGGAVPVGGVAVGGVSVGGVTAGGVAVGGCGTAGCCDAGCCDAGGVVDVVAGAGGVVGGALSSKMPVHTGFHPYFKVSGKTICHNLVASTYFDYNDNCEKPLGATYDASNKVEAVVTTANPDGSILFWEVPIDSVAPTANAAAPLSAPPVNTATCGGAPVAADASDVPAACADTPAATATSGKIRISASPEYRYWMLWSVDGCDFLCVEPWTARNQEILRGDELLMVAPGEELNLWVSMERLK